MPSGYFSKMLKADLDRIDTSMADMIKMREAKQAQIEPISNENLSFDSLRGASKKPVRGM